MGKLIALVAAAGLAAGGGAYVLTHPCDSCGSDPADLATCPTMKVGTCPSCSGGTPASTAYEPTAVEAEACCADAGAVARASNGTTVAVAVAGPAALFGTAKKKACCCCEDGPTSGLAAVTGVAAIAGK